jgi:hypothetical protein
VSYVDELPGQLAAVGIGGRRRVRILAEIADHLTCDPDATLGDPKALAREFADELGTFRARRAAFGAFAALAVAGAVFVVAFLTLPGGGLARATSGPTPLLRDLGAAITVLAAQLAFVTGVLAEFASLARETIPGGASVVAGTIAIATAMVGVVQSDVYDGALRGLADGCACLAGFATLVRYLGLRG